MKFTDDISVEIDNKTRQPIRLQFVNAFKTNKFEVEYEYSDSIMFFDPPKNVFQAIVELIRGVRISFGQVQWQLQDELDCDYHSDMEPLPIGETLDDMSCSL